MSAPGHECERRNGGEDNLQSAVGAMAVDAFKGARGTNRAAPEMAASMLRPGLLESAFHIRFADLFWSARRPNKPTVAALQFNPNRQARTL